MKKILFTPPPRNVIALLLMVFNVGILLGQHARDGWSPWGSNCRNVPYDDNNNTSGSITPAIGTLPSALASGNWTLIFSDEFNGPTTIDARPSNFPTNQIWFGGDATATNSKWTMFDLHPGTDDPDAFIADISKVSVQNGNLKLETDCQCTSNGTVCQSAGAIRSRGFFRFGYIEARIRIPHREKDKTGMFPSFWLWRASERYEEFDIFEFFQMKSGIIHKHQFNTTQYYDDVNMQSPNYIHTGFIQKEHKPLDDATVSGGYKLDFSKDFFVWGVRWTPDSFVYYLNNVRIGAMKNKLSVWNPFLQDGKHILFQSKPVVCAIDTEDDFPNWYSVDYVRVYKETNDFPMMLRTGAGPDESIHDFCVPATATASQPNPPYMYAFLEDHIPGMSCDFSIIRPNGTVLVASQPNKGLNTYPTGYDGAKWYFSPTLPFGTPAGTYTVRLVLTYPNPAGTGSVTKTINRNFNISTSPPISPTGTAINTTYDYNQTSAILNIVSPCASCTYSWYSSAHDVSPQGSVQCLGTATIESGLVYVRAQNLCGVSNTVGSKNVSLHCDDNSNCPGCPVRMIPNQDTLREVGTAEVIQPLSQINPTGTSDAPQQNSLLSIRVSLYPNPANQAIAIELNLPQSGFVKIWNGEGRFMGQWEIQEGKCLVQTSAFAEGIYHTQIIIDGYLFNRDFTIQH